MKLLIVGAGTPVGKELISLLRQRKISFHSLKERQINLANAEHVAQAIDRVTPDQVVNLASFKAHSQQAVLQAERAAEEAQQFNLLYARNLAQICSAREIPLLQLSSAYVFDGEKKLGYNEQDDPMPAGVYGRSALQAELEVQKLASHTILRSGWLFGATLHDQIKNWIKTVKKNNGELQVQRRRFSPTAIEDVARVLLAICQQVDCHANAWGIYHYSGLETKKESEFVLQVLKYASQHDEQVYQLIDTVKLTEVGIRAPEVANTTLSGKKIFDTFGVKQRSWHGSLQSTIKAIYHHKGDKSANATRILATRDIH